MYRAIAIVLQTEKMAIAFLLQRNQKSWIYKEGVKGESHLGLQQFSYI